MASFEQRWAAREGLRALKRGDVDAALAAGVLAGAGRAVCDYREAAGDHGVFGDAELIGAYHRAVALQALRRCFEQTAGGLHPIDYERH